MPGGLTARTARPVRALARAAALAGGLTLVALVVMTVLSVSGRALVAVGLGPIAGDFELVEAGAAFAVFAFLPWCHLNRSHASVEIFAMRLGPAVNRGIDIAADFLMLAAAVVICWRHGLGALDKYRYAETTFILQFPVWWAYAASLAGAVVFVIVAAWRLSDTLAGGQPAPTATAGRQRP